MFPIPIGQFLVTWASVCHYMDVCAAESYIDVQYKIPSEASRGFLGNTRLVTSHFTRATMKAECKFKSVICLYAT